MQKLSRNETIGVISLLALIAVIVGAQAVHSLSARAPGIVLRPPLTPASAPAGVPGDSNPASSRPPAVTTAPMEVVVHIVGAVKKRGTYHLPSGARVEDAIKAAGGATDEANTDALNLAAKVEDGVQLYVPTHQEQPEDHAPENMATATRPIAKSPSKSASRAGRSEGRSDKAAKLTDPKQGVVNINAATAEELERLPGVGPATAQRILEYRKESGRFQSPEDLMSVSGIGPKKFEKMQAFLRVK